MTMLNKLLKYKIERGRTGKEPAIVNRFSYTISSAEKSIQIFINLKFVSAGEEIAFCKTRTIWTKNYL